MSSALEKLVNEVLTEARQVKTASLEKVAEEIQRAPATQIGNEMRKLAHSLKSSSVEPSYDDLHSLLREYK